MNAAAAHALVHELRALLQAVTADMADVTDREALERAGWLLALALKRVELLCRAGTQGATP